MSQVKEIFAEALERHGADRAAFLDQACAGQAELRAEVESLLLASAQTDAFREMTAPTLSERPGGVVGRYKLLEQIGEGGFGVVFMAEQETPVRRRVALKIIKLGMETKQVVARFEAERQALAMMDHPGIAKVFDGGATDTGRPYFVMELVRGIPITTYCDQHKLNISHRLELLSQVCQAVQHAHQKGIIHRDIKPSNVLISTQDDRPVAKVIDFGIAKATQARLTEKTLFTEFRQMVGTPEYMSPEQAGGGLDIDTRSDIYSLGVLLYELLAGSPPFDPKELRSKAFGEIQRIIREVDPPAPSTRLSTMKESLPSIAAQRAVEPRKLAGMLRGDLDWIVMKALEKDRAGRYGTATGLARDIERYLANEPVEARPPAAFYRFGKFARRNKRGLTVAALVLFFLILLGAAAGRISRDRAVRRQVVEDAAGRALKEADDLLKRDKWQEALAVAERAQAALASGEASDQLQQRVRDRLADLKMIQRLEELRVQLGDDLDSESQDQAYGRLFAELGIDVEKLSPAAVAARIERRPATAVRMAAALDHWSKVRRDTLLHQNGDPATWKRLLAAAELADPDPWRVRLRQLMGQEDLNALRQLADAADITALPVQSLDLMGNALIFGGDPGACVAWLRRAQLEHPSDVIINFDLAFHLSDVPTPAWFDVIRFYQAALAACPQSERLRLDLAGALFRAGSLDDSRRIVSRTLRMKPDDEGAAKIMSNLAVSYAAIGNSIEALHVIDELLARPDTAGSHVSADAQTVVLCVRQFQRWHQTVACRVATEAIERKSPADAIGLYNVGCCRALMEATQPPKGGDAAAARDKDEAELAIAWLKKAIAAGFADIGLLRRDTDLDSLRSREDFRALQAEVEAKSGPLARAQSYILLNQWDDAAAEYAKVPFAAQPGDDEAFARACLFAVRDDNEGYHRFCQDLIRRVGHEDAWAYHLARISAVVPEAAVDPAQTLQWAKQVISRTHNPWDYHLLGMAQFRAGQLENALQSLTKANNRGWRYRDLTWFGLALVHQRLGHPAEARQCLSKGIQWLEREGPTDSGRSATLLPQDWLEAQLLRHEAEAALNQPAKESSSQH